MNIDQLIIFRLVAELGSFAAVAKQRNTDPSNISRNINSLEATVGARLFHRTTRQLRLTEDGAQYLSRITPLIDELVAANDALANARKTPSGIVRLAASVSFGQTMVLPLLSQFAQRHPHIALELIFNDVVNNLIAEGVDIAIRQAPIIDGDLICSKLMDTRYRVVSAPSLATLVPKPLVPGSIRQMPLLHYTLPSFQNEWQFRDPAGRQTTVGVQRGQFYFSSAQAVVSAMLQGLGVALIAEHLIAEHLANGLCIDLFADYEVTATSFETAAWLVYPSRSFLPAKTRAVIDFLREIFQIGADCGSLYSC